MKIYHEASHDTPKISFFVRNINGKDIRIKLVRKSLICRLLSKNESVILGRTIYARNKTVTKKVFNRAVVRMNELYKVGVLNYVLKWIKDKFK
jgi:hypothetical protein